MEIDDLELRNAIKRKEFVLHYQPQINITNGSVVGLEAFVRCNHPQRGLMFPDSFLGGRIRDLGIIEEFGWLIAERGLTEIHKFSDSDLGMPRLTLKLPSALLENDRFPDQFSSLAVRHNVPLHKVAVELSGSGSFNRMTSALDVTSLRMNGVQLAVHDYGSGSIGIQELRQVSATELKIDRRFVQNMLPNESDRTIVRRLILIAHELNMKAVAEGVETEQQLEFLCQKNCDYAQGFYFSHPLRPEGMAAWLNAYHPWHCRCC